jgi:hypothetical protein
MKKLLLMVLLCLPVVGWAGEDFDRGYVWPCAWVWPDSRPMNTK